MKILSCRPRPRPGSRPCSNLATPATLRSIGAALLAAAAVLLAGCEDKGSAAAPTTPAATGEGGTGTAPTITTPPQAPPPSRTAGPSVDAATAAPSSAISTGDAASGPRITFSKEVHDFGVITDTEKHSTSFPFTNTGRGTLIISDIKAACGCTVPTLAKRQYQPGESGAIEIVFDPKGKQGPTDKQITVMSNVEPEGITELRLTSNIRPLVQFDRMQRLGTLQRGQEHRSVVTLRYSDPNLAIANVRINNPNLSVKLSEKGIVDSTAGGVNLYRAELELIVHADAPWGVIFATRISFDAYGRPTPEKDPVNYAYDIFVLGEIFGELTGRPSIISLGQLTVGGEFDRAALISRPSGVPFSILSAQVVETTLSGVQTRIEQQTPASYNVYVYGKTGTFRGAAKGRVRITTDIPGEEVLEIRFSGLVK